MLGDRSGRVDTVLARRPEGLSYLGLMGSRRKIERIVSEVSAGGFELQAEPTFRAPIGLPIGGETPGDLAVSILAEMIQVRAEASVGNQEPEISAAER